MEPKQGLRRIVRLEPKASQGSDQFRQHDIVGEGGWLLVVIQKPCFVLFQGNCCSIHA